MCIVYIATHHNLQHCSLIEFVASLDCISAAAEKGNEVAECVNFTSECDECPSLPQLSNSSDCIISAMFAVKFLTFFARAQETVGIPIDGIKLEIVISSTFFSSWSTELFCLLVFPTSDIVWLHNVQRCYYATHCDVSTTLLFLFKLSILSLSRCR